MPDPEPTSRTQEPAAADPDWFRTPTRREHWIGFGLFTGFGLFFLLLFIVQRHGWFSWVVLLLAAISTWRGLRHAGSALAGGGHGRR